MLHRIGAVAFNTYREAVRARVLHGLFGLATATAGYSLVVGAYTLDNNLRVVSDLGAASISLYGIIVAIVLGATSLYRELELKTIFPILARPLRRWEYLFGKYLGTLLTLAVFIAANAGVLLLAVAVLAGRSLALTAGFGLGSVLVAGLLAYKLPRWRTHIPVVWALVIAVIGWGMADGAFAERRVLFGAAVLALAEVAIVAALATLFAAFSSPFLTAIFTFGVFVVGRSADTLARLPARIFGETIQRVGEMLSYIVPNLMLYVPPRPLLTGEAPGEELLSYMAGAAVYAVVWSAFLLAAASLIFRRRDFL